MRGWLPLNGFFATAADGLPMAQILTIAELFR